MADEPDPPRKFYGLKPTEFERVNPPVPQRAENAPPPSARPPPIDPNAPIDVNDLIRSGTAGAPLLRRGPPPPARPDAANEIHAILADNLARANAAGLNDVAAPKPFRRRRRDFWVLMIFGNGFIAALYAVEMLFGFQVMCMAAQMPQEFGNLIRFAIQNPTSYAMALLGMVFFSGCIAWLMFGIMENY